MRKDRFLKTRRDRGSEEEAHRLPPSNRSRFSEKGQTIMTTHHQTTADIDPSMTLTMLKDSDEVLTDSGQDIRGRKVLAKDGEEIGKVDALLVDAQESKIRFMRVEAGGFLGLGEKRFLIPVDAITRVDKDTVSVDQTRDKVLGAPVYDPEVIKKPSYPDIYSYYGFGPYWGTGYLYPFWW
jgi:sporulation protein YlmC with PRC-barrel domain